MNTSFQIAVIGGGSAGILTVSELMTSQYNQIAWIDPNFDCGELNLYKYIPSNTKVSFQLKVANQSSWFKNIQQTQIIADTFNGLDPNKTSLLGQSYEMFKRMTNLLDQTAQDKITKFQDEAIAYTQQQDCSWKIQLKSGHIINAYQIIFCVGGHNRDLREMIPKPFLSNPQLKYVNLIDAMCPQRSPNTFDKDDVVVVIGASHSGLLALKTLYEMKDRPKKIFLMYLDDLYFADHNVSTGEIKYDFIGLKGDVATFTKKILQTKPNDIVFVKSSQQAMLDLFPECTKVVTAVGFQRNKFGIITRKDGTIIQDNQIQYDDCMSNLLYEGQIIDGMYGGGIAFPEKKIDVSGLPGCAVGFFKQMNYVQKLLKSGVLRPRL